MGRHYCQIDLAERRELERLYAAGFPVDQIAEKLGRHRSTVFRELKRNFFSNLENRRESDYFCTIADNISRERRAVHRKLRRHPTLREAVHNRLKAGWSPEQIAGRMRLERHPIRVCAETIYRHIYSWDMRDHKLWALLPERRRRRRLKYSRKSRYRNRFGPDVHILKRPEAASKRIQFGHWECDLVHFRKIYGKANLTSIVERVSRFTVLLKNNDRTSRPIMNQLINMLSPLPFEARRSITFDRGTEFTEWPYLQAGLGAQTWFCDPQSPWRKGTVENTNRRTRRYLPREQDPAAITNRYLKSICDRLNATPRKCLGYQTPAEVFKQKLLEECP